MSRFFVTLNHPNGGVVPLVDSEDQVATFNTFEQAKDAMQENMLGRAYGGRVYDIDMDGVDV